MSKSQQIYIIGSKGIPAKYGGFETFVDKLTEYKSTDLIEYNVACMMDNSEKSDITEKAFVYNNAKCFNIKVPNIGPARALYYDYYALKYAIKLAKKNNDKNPIFYVLACRIGPVIGMLKKEISSISGKLYVNPDGHEWLRQKWSFPIRKYWKYSEKLMVKHADLLICDSKNIEKHIKKEYEHYTPKTTYIAYGTDLDKTNFTSNNEVVKNWFNRKNIIENEYYLIVGRFVPENNYETMIREFMKSKSKKDLVIITNMEHNKFFETLSKETGFDSDSRIRFVGTVYNQELLKYIRENAFAYIHGHEVGGTNPSLLEALYFTKLNLLLDVGFNKEVGENSALYWNKNNGDLSDIINKTEKLDDDEIEKFNILSKQRIEGNFDWPTIVDYYQNLFKSN